MAEKEKGKEKEKEQEIKLPKCILDPETRTVVCKVKEELYDEIRKGKPVKKIVFEIEEEK